MTKHELLRRLEPFMDETEILVWFQGGGEGDIGNVAYVPPAGELAAFLYLVTSSTLGKGAAHE